MSEGTYGQKMRNAEDFRMVKGAFSDAYLFYKKFHGRPMEPGLCEEMTAGFTETCKKYGNGTFCTRLMLAVFAQIEEETR